MKLKILDGVPIPNRQLVPSSEYDDALGNMKVGQCFYIPTQGTGAVSVEKARGIIHYRTRMYLKTGRKFVSRVSADRKSIGVWRIQ